jgi:chitodextrinase
MQQTTTRSTELTLTGLNSGAVYEYRLRSRCFTGKWSEYSPIKTFTTLQNCSAPTGNIVLNVSFNSAAIGWQSVSGASQYEIRYRLLGQQSWISFSTSSTFHTLTGLTSSTSYEYQVRAYCASTGVWSDYSITQSFRTLSPSCAVPSGLSSSSVTSNSAVISWQGVVGAIEYEIRYRLLGQQSWISFSTSSTFHTLTGLTSSTTYEYQVRAYCVGGGWSNYSDVQSFTTLGSVSSCMTPFGSSSSVYSTKAFIQWEAVGDASLYEISYRIIGQQTWKTVTSSFKFGWLENLVPSSAYEYRVRAYCQSVETWSDYSLTQSFTTLAPRPSCSAPVGLRSSVSSNSVVLSWEPVHGASQYEISYRIQGQGWTSTVGSSPYTLANLAPSTAYEYRVRAYCAEYVLGDYSEVKSFVTSMASSCSPPSLRGNSHSGGDSIIIYFQGVAGATGYEINYRHSNGQWQTRFISGSSSYSSIALKGLGPGNYEYYMRSRCANSSWSSYSSTSSFQIGSPQNPNCLPPVGLTHSFITNTTVFINWQPAPEASFYELEFCKVGESCWISHHSVGARISDLVPGATYEYRLHSICYNSGRSVQSATGSFTVPSALSNCLAPSGIRVEFVTVDRAKLAGKKL